MFVVVAVIVLLVVVVVMGIVVVVVVVVVEVVVPKYNSILTKHNLTKIHDQTELIFKHLPGMKTCICIHVYIDTPIIYIRTPISRTEYQQGTT